MKPLSNVMIDITPYPKPRMTQRDKWAKRSCVLRYRAFADQIRLAVGGMDINGYEITFAMPMPKSWSKKKKLEMDGKFHTQKPDIDNLLKALMDALYGNDSFVSNLGGLKKIWAREGYILLMRDLEAVK